MRLARLWRAVLLLCFLIMALSLTFSQVPPADAASYAFANPLGINVPVQGAANPYPSLINVTNATGVITDINVTLSGINHYFPDDFDIVLRAPGGRAVLLMSDSCGANLMLGVNLIFDDEAPAFLSNSGACFSGSYKPTNYDDIANTLPAPAPNSYSFALSHFDGINPNGVWELFVFDDQVSSSNLGAIASGWSLTLSTTIVIPQSGIAAPYPSRRTYTGITGAISDLNLRLIGLTHGLPDDLDLMLVSPFGRKVMFMSDACGGTALINVTLTINDEAAAALPNAGPCTTAEYRPGNYLSEGGENMPTPAPLGPYFGTLGAFDGFSPNGTWSLYIRDDQGSFSGTISDWELIIATTPTPPNLIQNSEFNTAFIGDANGNWGVDGSITYQFNSGIFEFYRNGPSAAVLQRTGTAIPSGGAMYASMQFGNSSAVRKRVTVLITDISFNDITFCSFWIPPGAPMRTYYMTTHTTQAWSNAMISFYAATDDNAPWLRLDKVTLQHFPTFIRAETLCIDPLTPPSTGTFSSANLLANPNFTNPTIAPWTTFGTGVFGLSGGVFEFLSTGSPAAVVEQVASVSTGIGAPLEATFLLGNSTSVRQRVTVLLRSEDFSDLQACVFWLPPGAGLQPYMIRTWATAAWNKTAISIYSSTVNAPGTVGRVRLDNVFYRQRYDLNVNGTECYTPGSLVDNSTEWVAELLTDEVLAEMQPTLEPTATLSFEPPIGELTPLPPENPVDVLPTMTPTPEFNSPGEGSVGE
jgi:subtilisin-like proprotein convertase family protein